MAQSVTYRTWDYSQYVRLEIIQVDNGADHVNVSCNLQVHSSFTGITGAPGNSASFDGQNYNGTLTAGTTSIDFNGTNGSYPSGGSGWYSVATKWIGTIPRSANTFSIKWYAWWHGTDKMYNMADIRSGSVSIMAYVPPNAIDTLSNYSAATLGTAVTFTITNSTSYAHTDAITYSIGSASGNVQTNISVPANSTKTVTWTPPTSLGAQIASAFTGVCVLTLTTSGVTGSRTYNCTLTVPSYTYSLSNPTVAKTTYTNIGGSSYVAGKHTAQWTAPTFPSAQYGATMTAMFYASYGGDTQPVYSTTITSGGTASYTGERAGTLVGTVVITDSRGVTKSAYRSVTYIANPSVSITSFSAQRSGQTTTVNYSAAGRYDSTISNNTGVLSVIRDNVAISTANGSSGTASLSGTATQLATESEMYTCTMVDGLGNKATRSITVSTSFYYIQVGGGANGKGVSIGRAASTSGKDSLEIGLPTIIDEPTRVARFREYMQTDADNNAMNSVIDILTPRVASNQFNADSYGTSDEDLAQVFRAYLIWLAKNFPYDFCQTHGILNHRGMYSIEVCLCRANVDTNGIPRLCMGTAYGYGVNAPIYRFGTNEHSFFCYPLGVTGQFMVQKAYLTVDTNNVSHSTDSVVMAPHVGYADLGLSATNTMAEGFYALIQWLKTNYGSNANIQKSRCIIHGTFAGRSNGVTERNFMYQVIFYDLSQAESSGTAPRYCTGWAMSMDSLKIFTFRNVNGNFKAYEHVGTEVTA